MRNYISQTEHATRSLVDLIAVDHKALENESRALRSATAKFDVLHQVFLANEFHTAANHYHAQMAQAGQAQETVGAKVKFLADTIDAKSASIAALSGALLQIAKQGISVIYGKPQNAPLGAKISGIPIKDIIWQGRNQSIHYENPKEISSAVVNLFSRIDSVRSDGVSWQPKTQRNYAFDIVNFLGWLDWKQFERHLLSIQRR
ncbi:MAG: hypothetical protein KUL86_06390 [Castellaniella sp.]|nr:hypothetical protein [Castellaniella sp.]